MDYAKINEAAQNYLQWITHRNTNRNLFPQMKL